MSAPLVTAWSFSRWSDYDQCPAKFKYKHIDRLPDPGSAAMQRGNDIHKIAERYVDTYPGRGHRGPPPMPPELMKFSKQFAELRDHDVDLEQSWGFRRDWGWIGRPGWFGDDVWYRQKNDVAVKYPDKTIDIIDHKTGKMYESNEQQVRLQSLGSFKRYPGTLHVTARLWYLDSGDEIIFEYPAADMAAIQKDWDRRVQPMFNDRRFAPRPNSKCGWCPYSKAKGGPCKF